MPIYAYRCESCGFEKDVLQKISDAPLTQCPSCGAAAFRKQVTAAGFQLKGSGWYVTDFRGGNSGNGGGGNGTSATATGAKAAGEPAASSSEGSKPAGDSAASSSTSGGSTTPSTTPSTAGAT
jgi:putative FmdB family regulatory protein